MAPGPAYHNANSPYGSGDPYYNESSGYITPMPVKKGTSKWVKFGIPVAIAVIVAAVVGGVVGSRAHNDKSSSVSGGSSSGGSSGDQAAAASSAASVKNAIGVFPTGTNSQYLVPLYPSTTNTAAFTSPTFHPTSDKALAWPADTFAPSNPSVSNLRPDRPRIIAPAYKWAALPALIASDPYMKQWNETIFGNATDYYNLPPVEYFMDGSSGILDNCRYVKQRVKAFAYVYRMTNDTKWVDRTWAELQNAVGDSFGPNNATKWNPGHFLDVAEMTAAFGIAYDWLYDALTDDQKSTIRDNIITYGLNNGLHGYENAVSGDFSGWWAAPATKGNWNCVCNDGMTIGALAILGDDTTGTAQKILDQSVPNALKACAFAVNSDGTWAETGNYWYFGTTGHAEMASALTTATGSDLGMLTTNPAFNLTGYFHMYGFGPGSLFDWGDHGPNKYTATANSMILYGDYFQRPEYVLFQRDRADAAEPFTMFWYNPTASGAFWDGLALDHFFDDDNDQWASMRSSWTDENALYVAIKAGQLQNHQNHNDLDVGDFVLDAMGHRWAGELGSADYNSPDYFDGDGQDAPRWTYYRKATQGQNTININSANQNVNCQPKILGHDTTGEKQGSSTVFDVPDGSTAYWTADTTSAYNDTQSAKRGIRLLNKRRQVLLQDEVQSTQAIQWRMHTNATVAVDPNDPTSATLTIEDKKLQMKLLSPSGAKFGTADPVRSSNLAPTPNNAADPLNPGVTVVTIDLEAGTQNIQVLFNPQWDGMSSSDFVTPPSVAIDDWSLKSHN